MSKKIKPDDLIEHLADDLVTQVILKNVIPSITKIIEDACSAVSLKLMDALENSLKTTINSIIDGKLAILESKFASLSSETSFLKKKLLDMDNQMREKDLVLYGSLHSDASVSPNLESLLHTSAKTN